MKQEVVSASTAHSNHADLENREGLMTALRINGA